MEGWQIHGGASPRALLLGHLQTGFSAFLGYCRPGTRDIEKRGAVFGLYLLASTQSVQYAPPILVSPTEMKTIAEFCGEDPECASILSSLITRGQIGFSAAGTAIVTALSEFPPAVVVTEHIPSRSRFLTSRESAERAVPVSAAGDIGAEMADYAALLAVVRSEATLDGVDVAPISETDG
jgi:hypothetical protein